MMDAAERARNVLERADALSEAVRRLRLALSGETREFGAALFAAFAARDAYQQARDLTPAQPAEAVEVSP